MNRLKYSVIIILISLCTPALSADKLSIQLKWYHKFQFAGYYAADMQGYFTDEKLQVELIEGGPQINHQHQLINNQSQYATIGSEAINSLAVGAPFVIVSSIFQHSPEVLITLKSSEIKTLSNLRGKSIMLSSEGFTGQILAMLKNNNLDAGAYITIDYDGDVNHLASQRVTAMYGYISNEPYKLMQMGHQVDVFSPQDFGVDFYGDALATTQSELRDNPKRVAAVRRAVIRGWNYALEHPEELIDYILKLETINPNPFNRAHQQYEARETAKLVDAVNIPLGNTSPDRWASMFDTFNEFNVGQAKFVPSFVYDELHINRLWQRQLFIVIGIIFLILIGLYIWNRTLRLKLSHAIASLDKIAFEDQLTQLPNRSAMLLYFQECRREHQRNRYLAIFDIANLQKINKTQGFQKADSLIVRVAEILTEKLSKHDRCYSLYGGKFALVCHSTSRTEFEQTANNIIQTITHNLKSTKLHSGGIELDFYLDTSDLTIRAELALQHSKSINAPLLVFFNKLIVESIERRDELFKKIREAIVNNQFVIFYQPKVNTSDAKIVGVEALMRWQHPQDGIVTPIHFLPVVENYPELMEQLEDCILEQIFSQVESVIHHFGAGSEFRVSINLSSMQFNRGSLLDYLLTKCKRFDVSPQHVEIELTESSMLEDLETAIRISHELQSAGFHVSLDDFGTGYSSLSYIQNLPVNIVKLDYSFVKNIPEDSRSGYVVEHIVSLAHKLGLRIVAEGVERKEQLEYLDNLDVDMIQGFYFHRPMPLEELFQIPGETLTFD